MSVCPAAAAWTWGRQLQSTKNKKEDLVPGMQLSNSLPSGERERRSPALLNSSSIICRTLCLLCRASISLGSVTSSWGSVSSQEGIGGRLCTRRSLLKGKMKGRKGERELTHWLRYEACCRSWTHTWSVCSLAADMVLCAAGIAFTFTPTPVWTNKAKRKMTPAGTISNRTPLEIFWLPMGRFLKASCQPTYFQYCKACWIDMSKIMFIMRFYTKYLSYVNHRRFRRWQVN